MSSHPRHIPLGARLALLREAAGSHTAREDICRRHGISAATLTAWRHDFMQAGLREVSLDDFRPMRIAAGEESELLDKLRKLEIMLRAKSAEVLALRGQLAGRRLIHHTLRK